MRRDFRDSDYPGICGYYDMEAGRMIDILTAYMTGRVKEYEAEQYFKTLVKYMPEIIRRMGVQNGGTDERGTKDQGRTDHR